LLSENLSGSAGAETAEQSAEVALRIVRLFGEHENQIQAAGRGAAVGLRIRRHLERNPVATIKGLAKDLGLSLPTIAKAVETLEGIGILRETTGKQRDRVYVYDSYLAILSEGTEPLPANATG